MKSFKKLLMVASLFFVQEMHTSSIPERDFVVVIASYNNKDWYQANLDSVFSQNYSHYRVIYIDDCSPDGTAKFVEEYIKARGLEHKVTLIKNTVRQRALANLYNAIWT